MEPEPEEESDPEPDPFSSLELEPEEEPSLSLEDETYFSTVSLLCANIFINKIDLLSMVENIFGVSPPLQVTEKMYFGLFVLLIQNYNSDVALFYIDNVDFLLVRHISKKNLFYSYVKAILKNNINLILQMGFISFAFVCCLQVVIPNSFAGFFKMILAIVQGYCKCCIIAFVQLILLLMYSSEKVLVILSTGSLIYSFLVQTIFVFLPVQITNNIIFYIARTILYVALVLIILLLFKKTFMKEWQKYAN